MQNSSKSPPCLDGAPSPSDAGDFDCAPKNQGRCFGFFSNEPCKSGRSRSNMCARPFPLPRLLVPGANCQLHLSSIFTPCACCTWTNVKAADFAGQCVLFVVDKKSFGSVSDVPVPYQHQCAHEANWTPAYHTRCTSVPYPRPTVPQKRLRVFFSKSVPAYRTQCAHPKVPQKKGSKC